MVTRVEQVVTTFSQVGLKTRDAPGIPEAQWPFKAKEEEAIETPSSPQLCAQAEGIQNRGHPQGLQVLTCPSTAELLG